MERRETIAWSSNEREPEHIVSLQLTANEAKEACYAIHDLEHLEDFPEKDREGWKESSIRRLLAFAKYYKDNE